MKLQTIIIGLKWLFICGVFLCVIVLSQVHNPISRSVAMPVGESLAEPVFRDDGINEGEKLAKRG